MVPMEILDPITLTVKVTQSTSPCLVTGHKNLLSEGSCLRAEKDRCHNSKGPEGSGQGLAGLPMTISIKLHPFCPILFPSGCTYFVEPRHKLSIFPVSHKTMIKWMCFDFLCERISYHGSFMLPLWQGRRSSLLSILHCHFNLASLICQKHPFVTEWLHQPQCHFSLHQHPKSRWGDSGLCCFAFYQVE